MHKVQFEIAEIPEPEYSISTTLKLLITIAAINASSPLSIGFSFSIFHPPSLHVIMNISLVLIYIFYKLDFFHKSIEDFY